MIRQKVIGHWMKGVDSPLMVRKEPYLDHEIRWKAFLLSLDLDACPVAHAMLALPV